MRVRVLRGSIVVSILLAGLLGTALTAWGQEADLDEFKNNLAPNVGSPEQAIDRMLEAAKLKPGETLYDLGCGDARILIAAAKRYKVKGVGIEISSRLAKVAAANVADEGLDKRIKIIHGDFMRVDLSPANVVTLYLATSANDTLRPNLEHYLKPNTRVVSYDYPIAGWTPIATSATEGHYGDTHTIYLYEVPNSINKK
ncbi:MAG: class I SAM-dependent methyltransferase [Acidobacteriaceae bacterium]|nr:class I SAM-dependent methyltransferase [Acidobacteriaceae bacterium]